MGLFRAFCLWVPVLIACRGVLAQDVISARSGVVNFSEGDVFLDNQPLNQQFGTFPAIREESVLRTEKGRAEILLTPGVFLRIDHETSVRLVSSALANTRVEFLSGCAILDSNDAAPGDSVVLSFKTFQLRFPKPGVYRLDSEPGVFETYTGEAQITPEHAAAEMIDESHQFFFMTGTKTKKYGDGAVDDFSEWARNRAEMIAADNRVADQSTADSDPPANPSFGGIVPSPSPAVPSYGTFGAPVFVDSGFLGTYSPFVNPLLFSPFPTIYVFPRWYGRNRWHEMPPHRSGMPLHNTGYPTRLSPVRTNYPRPTFLRPAPLPMRSGTVNAAPRRAIVIPQRRPSAGMSRPVPVVPRRR